MGSLYVPTLADVDPEDLAGGCCAEIGDVEIAVRAECHTGRKEKAGGYIFDLAGAVKAYNLAIPRCWQAGSGGEFERIKETIRAEIDGDDGSKTGARSREAKLLELVAATEAEEEGPRACA